MRKAILASFLALTAVFLAQGYSEAWEAPESLLQAIYRAEGGEKAKAPYGLIHSSWCMDEPGWCKYYANEVIRVHRKRWERAGNPGDWIEYLGSKWAPTQGVSDWESSYNKNWIRNVRFFLNKGERS